MFKRFLTFVTLLVVLTNSCIAQQPKSDSIFNKQYIKRVMLNVFNWQLQNPVSRNTSNGDDWARAVFYSGIMRAYEHTKNEAYLDSALRWSQSVGFKLGERYHHADDHTRGQAFLELYKYKKDKAMISNVQAVYDSLIAQPIRGREEWWWCDALFMSPPVLVRLAKVTGDDKYNKYMNEMWWDTTDFLFDKDESLYYRDKSYFAMRTATNKKVFWSRGNGWVMGGLVQVLEHLPKNDPYYARYLNLYKKMAAKIATLQQADGLWRASLLDNQEFTNKETSGSAFFVFALAWGVNHHHLDKDTYMPVVRKGWEALTSAVQPSGKLTWVQQIGSEPKSVKESDNQEYGSGAFLMAGTEMLALKSR
jgi:unsaturated rhamnogalacturonyl hydrolase